MQLYVWIHKWRRVILKALNLEMLIAEVWQNFWALKINCFVWQVLYQIPATNVWHWKKIPWKNIAIHCGCIGALSEMVHHYF